MSYFLSYKSINSIILLFRRFNAVLNNGCARGDEAGARGLPAGATAALPLGAVPSGGQLLAERALPPTRLRAAATGAATTAGRGRRVSRRRPRRPAERHPAAVARLHAAPQLGRPTPLRPRRHLTVSRSLGVKRAQSRVAQISPRATLLSLDTRS